MSTGCQKDRPTDRKTGGQKDRKTFQLSYQNKSCSKCQKDRKTGRKIYTVPGRQTETE